MDGDRHHRRAARSSRKGGGPLDARRLDVELGQGRQGAVPLAHGRGVEGLPGAGHARRSDSGRARAEADRRRRADPDADSGAGAGAEARAGRAARRRSSRASRSRPRRSRPASDGSGLATTVSFSLTAAAQVTVTVTATAAGLPLLTLFTGRMPAGATDAPVGRRHPRERPLQARRLGDEGRRGHAAWSRPST